MEQPSLSALRAYSTFNDAAKACVDFLQQRFGMQMWMVTRTAGSDWIVLENADRGYGVAPGATFQWSDSFCSRMVRGEGPNFAPDVSRVPTYLAAPIGKQVKIGAYVGLPLVLDDGALFGTLCAIDPLPQSDNLEKELPLLELLARLLTSLLQRDVQRLRLARPRGLPIPDAPDALLLDEASWMRNLSGTEREAACLGLRIGLVAIDLHDDSGAPSDPMPLLTRLAAAIEAPAIFAMRGQGRLLATLSQVGEVHPDELHRRLLSALAGSGHARAGVQVVSLGQREPLRPRVDRLTG